MIMLRQGTGTWLVPVMALEEGQDLIESSVLLAFIALVVWVATMAAGAQISLVWSVVSSTLVTFR